MSFPSTPTFLVGSSATLGDPLLMTDPAPSPVPPLRSHLHSPPPDLRAELHETAARQGRHLVELLERIQQLECRVYDLEQRRWSARWTTLCEAIRLRWQALRARMKG